MYIVILFRAKSRLRTIPISNNPNWARAQAQTLTFGKKNINIDLGV